MRFASPRKRRAVVCLPLKSKKRLKLSKSSSPSTSIIVSPSAQSTLETEMSTSFQSVEDDSHASISTYPDCVSNDSLIRNQETTNDLQVTLNAALMSRIEVLEQENTTLRRNVIVAGKKPFRIQDIMHDDTLIRAYTGFPSNEILLAFFQFLGPVVNHLKYWGTSTNSCSRKKKLDPLNCLFLTLVKLRLNLSEQDLAFRFGLSTSTVSRYFITWVCFLYNHLKEIDWSPSIEQVAGTLPHYIQG